MQLPLLLKKSFHIEQQVSIVARLKNLDLTNQLHIDLIRNCKAKCLPFFYCLQLSMQKRKDLEIFKNDWVKSD